MLKQFEINFKNKYYHIICTDPPWAGRAVLRPSHTAAITITTQRECILLVEMLQPEYAHAHSTNRERAFLLLSGPVWPGLYNRLHVSFVLSLIESPSLSLWQYICTELQGESKTSWPGLVKFFKTNEWHTKFSKT